MTWRFGCFSNSECSPLTCISNPLPSTLALSSPRFIDLCAHTTLLLTALTIHFLLSIFSATSDIHGMTFNHSSSSDSSAKPSIRPLEKIYPPIADKPRFSRPFLCWHKRTESVMSEYFLLPEKATSSLKQMKCLALQAAEKHSCAQINTTLMPVSAQAASEPLQGWILGLFAGIHSPGLRQQLLPPLGGDQIDENLVNPASAAAWGSASETAPSWGPSAFGYASILGFTSLPFVSHTSRTWRKWPGCNSDLDRGKSRKFGRKHLEEWNKLASALITATPEWVFFGLFFARSNCWLLS